VSLIEVEAFGDLEAEPLEGYRHVGSVALGILVLGRVPAGRIADHQGDAIFGGSCATVQYGAMK
jgi:hypothetical protein